MPKVSVVIPCFNQGAFLAEAIDSIFAQSFQNFEIIVVNDGSTDELTNRICKSLTRAKTTVITTNNQGLAAARNNGIAKAKGEYILPLDADDRIAPQYLEEAVAVLDGAAEVGIVYCRAYLFGAVETEWLLPAYSVEEMLQDNVIFCTALFRKSDWQLVDGYDTGMIYGWEDYDFWLSLIERGRKVKQLAGHYFYYRVSPDSMVRSKEKWQKVEMFKRIYQRHTAFIGAHIDIWLSRLIESKETYLTSRLYVDCGNGVSDRDSVARKIMVGRQQLSFSIRDFKQRRAIRFDPVDCPACLRVEAIEVTTKRGRTAVSVRTTQTNARYWHDNLFLFSTDDPQIYFQFSEELVQEIEEVTLRLDIEHVGEKALQEIVTFQAEKLAQRDRSKTLFHRLAAVLGYFPVP